MWGLGVGSVLPSWLGGLGVDPECQCWYSIAAVRNSCLDPEAASGGSGVVSHLSCLQGVPASPRPCLAPGAQQELLPCARHPGRVWGILEPQFWTVCLEALGEEKSLQETGLQEASCALVCPSPVHDLSLEWHRFSPCTPRSSLCLTLPVWGCGRRESTGTSPSSVV